MRQRLAGFSLVELAIVLVILGLLVGGALTGKELIRAAEFRKISTDVEKYVVATNAFKLRFNALPGDFDQASRFWSTYCNKAADVPCNGNANGVAAQWDGSFYEYTMYWRHLRLAELIEFDASGFNHHPRQSGVAGDNIPKTGFGAGIYVGGLTGNTYNLPEGNYNFLTVGWYRLASLSWMNLPTTPSPGSGWANDGHWTNAEAALYDQKFDDGKGSNGRIWGGEVYWARPCKTSPTGDYIIDNTTACPIVYIRPF
jgi:prepilin-type N-terminal cleavage/methylation domain-containing protein